MSRRTPIKELIADESTTPASPIRRSTRIAGRRSSISEENNDLDRLSVSSASSQKSVNTRTRAASKSPILGVSKEDQRATRTQRRGSTSSLIEDELESITRSSPVPAKLSRRIVGRSISCSPISEIENKASTPQKENKPRRGRRLSSINESSTPLESIKEVETKSSLKDGTSIDESRDEDLPFKKKKAVLMQTIAEKTVEDLNVSAKSNGDVHLEENASTNCMEDATSKEKHHTLNTKKDSSTLEENTDTKEASIEKKDELNRSRKGSSTLEEEKELVVLLHNISASTNGLPHQQDGDIADKSQVEEMPKLGLHLSHSDEDNRHEDEEEGSQKNPTVKSTSDTGQHSTAILPEPTVSVEKNALEASDLEYLTPSKKSKEGVTAETGNFVNTQSEVSPVSEKNVLSASELNSTGDMKEHDESTISINSTGTNPRNQDSTPREESLITNDESFTPDKSGSPKSKPSACSPKKSLPSLLNDNSLNVNDAAENTRESHIKESAASLSLNNPSNGAESLLESTDAYSFNSGQSSVEAHFGSPTSTENGTGTVLVASNTTPLRRSPRLYTHVAPKNCPDTAGTPTHNKQNNSRSPSKSNDKISEIEIKGNSKNTSEESFKDQQLHEEDKQLNKTYNSSIDIDLDPVLKEKIATLTETLEVDSSSEGESVTHFIDDMAEEGEEDTPSEGSNDIIDVGESVGSTASQIDSDKSYEVDSFIDDNEEEIELLSGEEYDLTQEKTKKTGKMKRILQIDSSDEDEDKDKNQVNFYIDNGAETIKVKDDSDIERMSTRPYCGLSPPTVISVRDSPECDERLQKRENEVNVATLINKQDNLESLEQIKELNKESGSSEVSEIIEVKSLTESNRDDVNNINTSKSKSLSGFTPNNSILEDDSSLTESKRRRQSSINITENVSLKDIADGSVSDRIMKVVEVFCSTVNKSNDASVGNLSLNLSFNYVDTSPSHENNDQTLSRKRVLSESVLDSYSNKKCLSKDRLDESKSTSFMEQKADTIHSPSKKLKVHSKDSQTTVENVSLNNKTKKAKQNSFAESSTENISPEKLKGKIIIPQIKINEHIDLNIPQKRSTPKKRKGLVNSPAKKLSIGVFEDTIDDDKSSTLQKIVSPKKQKRVLVNSNNVEFHEEMQSPKKKTVYDVSIHTQKTSTPAKQKETEFVETKEIFEEISMQSSNIETKLKPVEESDKITSTTKKNKKIKQKRLAESVDSEIPLQKKSKKKHVDSNAENLQQSTGKKKKTNIESDEVKMLLKDTKISKRELSSDSEMSDDLDKQIHGKYNIVKSRKRKASKPEIIEEKQTNSDSSWQIQYLPENIKAALVKSDSKSTLKHMSGTSQTRKLPSRINKSESVKSIAKHTSEVVMKSKRIPKLLPSSDSSSNSWQLDRLNTSIKPTASKKIPVVTQLHAKDFKNRATFDSKRVKRMETKELLKKKEKM